MISPRKPSRSSVKASASRTAEDGAVSTSGMHPSLLCLGHEPTRRPSPVQHAGMRLNAWLARAGVASRRKSDELIKAGRVTVNGEPGQLNTFVAADDDVRLDGRPLAKQRLAYVLLHKPGGVVTTASDPHGRPTVVGLVGHPGRVVPVGRLDAETTGALVLTNDGELAHRLAHPRYQVDKVYVVQLDRPATDAQLERLATGVE